jgi:hypothetical protein
MQSNISRLLKQRGHNVTKEGSEKEIFLPDCPSDTEQFGSLKTILYDLMQRDGFRKSLRNWAFEGTFSETSHGQGVRAYIELCNQFGGWPNDINNEQRQMRYAKTFEWYISELLRREFGARASGFALRLEDAHSEDEFDCIALLDEGTVFVECKTGRNSSIYKDAAKFIRRDVEIVADYSFYLFDRDYIFQREGDDIPKLSRERAQEQRILGIHQVSIGKHKFFDILSTAVYGRYFLASSSFDGLEDRIRYMIRYCNEGNQPPRNRSSLFSRKEIFCYGIDPRR